MVEMRKSLITEVITGPEMHKVHISIDGLCRADPGPEPLEAERRTESNQSLAAIGLFCFFIFGTEFHVSLASVSLCSEG